MNDSTIITGMDSVSRTARHGRKKDSGMRTGVFMLILFAVTFVFHLIEFRAMAWSIDEYIFATGGQKIVADGVLYKDFGDNKPPLIYCTYAFLYWLSGEDFFNFFFLSKFATILVLFLSGVAFYFTGKNLGGKRLGMASALLFEAYSICGPAGEVLGGRTEIYAMLLAVTSIYFFSKDKFSFRFFNMLISAFILSVSTIYNAKFGITGVVYLAFVAYKRRSVRGAVPPMAGLAAGYLPLVVVVPLYFYMEGVYFYYRFWQSTVFSHYLHILPFYYLLPAGLLVLVFFAGVAPLSIFSLYRIVAALRAMYAGFAGRAVKGAGRLREIAGRAIAFVGPRAARDPRNDVFVFLMLLLLFQYGSFFVGGIPGIRYFYMMYIPLCFFGAQGFLDAYKLIREKSSLKDISWLLKAVMILFLAGSPVYFFLIDYNSRKEMAHESMEQYRDVVEYIRINIPPDQRIYVWSNMHPIYLLSGRTVATSMVYPTEFLTRYYYFTGDFQRFPTAWDIFFQQLESDPPALILDNTGNFTTQNTVLYAKKNGYIKEKLDEFRRYVKNNYEYKITLNGYRIFKRR